MKFPGSKKSEVTGPTTNGENNRGDPTLPLSHPNRRRTGNTDGVLSKGMRGHAIAMSAEFLGTTLFLWFALSATQIANTVTPAGNSDTGQLFYISLAFGFSLAVNAWVFYRVSGGLFNPAVTLGLCLAGALPWLRGLLLLLPQMIAGMVAAGLVSCMFPGPMSVNTALNHGTSVTQGLFIEMFLTFLLVITVLLLAAEKSKATFIAPVGIGLALFVAELTGVYFTGGSLNPTRSFGPSVATRFFPTYHWIYWLGPFMGAALAAGVYKTLKYANYEEANPGQDAISPEEQAREQERIESRVGSAMEMA
ncbi:hypothetical protein MMC25_002179 [Agyrium rufum]|nr:hypothetical protein [Agyrium rufum]